MTQWARQAAREAGLDLSTHYGAKETFLRRQERTGRGWGSDPHPGWVGVDPHCPTVPSLQKNHLTFGHVASLRCTTGSCVVVACCAPWIRRLLGRAAIPGSGPNRGRGWQAGPPVPRSTRSFSQVLELFFFHLALLQNLCKALWRRTIWIPPLVH